MSKKSVEPPYPSLIEVEATVEPILRAKAQITDIREALPRFSDGSIELKGVFALGIAGLETALGEAYLYFLRLRPASYHVDKFEVAKADLFAVSSTRELYERRAEVKVRKDMYASLRKQLQSFAAAAEIEIQDIDESAMNVVLEAKETRNLLLHNRLITNADYVEKAGPAKRHKETGHQLNITVSYTEAALDACGSILGELIGRLRSRYINYDKEALLRRIWSYLFTSSVMPFDDYWEIVPNGEQVYMKQGRYENQLASSEKMFLSVWRHHFNGWHEDGYRPINMRSLDRENQAKMAWFLSILPHVSLG